jgi:hypothetical protein
MGSLATVRTETGLEFYVRYGSRSLSEPSYQLVLTPNVGVKHAGGYPTNAHT